MTASVALIFPPLVDMSFGQYYPSIAVLTGFLEHRGVAVWQEDLNEQFVDFLLSERMLGLLGAGRVPGAPPDSLPAAIARWASGRQNRFTDAAGRHRAGTQTGSGGLLSALAKPFQTDPGATELRGLDTADRLLGFYREFYQASGIVTAVRGVALVGLSVPMGPQLIPALLLAGLLKSAHPGLRIVLGGPTISLMDPADLGVLLGHYRAVDCAVRFDGEYPLADLASQALDGRWAPATVPGVSARDGAEVVHCPPGTGPDLNRLPYPVYSRRLLDRLADPSLSITQARGCYWGKCDYCDFVELYNGSPPFRGRRPETFAAELAHLAATYGVARFTFITESIPPAFARRLCQLLLERGTPIRWDSFAMVDRRFDRELLDLMVRAGCEFLVVGLETTSTRLLRLVHKSADREENFRFLRDARQVGMRLRVNLIPDLPSATYDEAMLTLADMEELADCVEAVAIFPFEPTRSSNVGRDPARFGLLPLAGSPAYGQAQYALNHLDSHDPGMTPDQRQEIHRRYRDFAQKVNGRAAQPADGSRPALVKVPVDDLDVHDSGDRLVCTHMRTRDRITLSAIGSKLLRPYLDGQPFRAEVLGGDLDPALASVFFDDLRAVSLIVPVAETLSRSR